MFKHPVLEALNNRKRVGVRGSTHGQRGSCHPFPPLPISLSWSFFTLMSLERGKARQSKRDLLACHRHRVDCFFFYILLVDCVTLFFPLFLSIFDSPYSVFSLLLTFYICMYASLRARLYLCLCKCGFVSSPFPHTIKYVFLLLRFLCSLLLLPFQRMDA